MASAAPRPLFLAGGSVRAAAASAIRAGFTPWCVDCFGDVDLVRECPTRVVHDYPKAIPEMLASGPAGGWMYTGAMENHPEIIEAVKRPLYGNRARLGLRHPRFLSEMRRMDLPVPRRPPDHAKPCVLKPYRSGGGVGIRFWGGEPYDAQRVYLQEWIEGLAVSVLFIGNDEGPIPVGLTRQIIGADWLNSPESFRYCGSILGDDFHAEGIRRLAAAMAVYRLRGLFGVDGVLRNNEFWPIEANPRYTASVEILERVTGRNLVAEHVGAFTGFDRIAPEPSAASSAFPGKAILYAPVDCTFPAAGPWDDDYPFADLRRRFADLPHPGQAIRRGQPVLTFFADGDSPMSTEAELRKIAGDLDRLLFGR
jgi:uncharacterized protein